ncbi:tripartite motif-containing protein 10-like [Excalfactoria chinensis]|uniref:tripartite motif-containing protein 10-like n=1 Tax=Excalfactoria chinensis TaxID=46218 RepID=UPI003B3AECB8
MMASGKRNADLEEWDAKIRKLTEDFEESDTELEECDTEDGELAAEIDNLTAELEERDRKIRKLTSDLGDVDTKLKERDRKITKLSSEIRRLTALLGDRDSKLRKLTSELAKCDATIRLFTVELGERHTKIGELTAEVGDYDRKLRRSEEKLVNVTLDPETAHPRLILSEDQKSVRWEYSLQESLDGPERFDVDPCVLGCEVFTSGRHCWVVDLSEGQYCAVGVSRESLPRKGAVSFNPDEGIWAVQQWGFKNRALTSPPTPLNLPRVPKKIRISLDYEWGEVAFFDAENQIPIFTFPLTCFSGERLRPWFWVELGSLSLPR